MSEREYDSLQSALASARMEGLPVTHQTEQDCLRVLSGEISIAELIQEMLARPAKAV